VRAAGNGKHHAMTKRTPRPANRPPQRHRTTQEYEHDTYKLKGKLKEPSACPQCGAVFHKGRWTWAARPAQAYETVCPACHRINDKYPKGMLTLNGPYVAAKREEIFNLVRNEEAKGKKEHPLARLMAIEERPEGTVILTTDDHLARRIAEALHHAYDGEFAFHYDEGEQFVRATWSR
jgi:NMD protein affecting ribosome stability and mRNA decay